MFPQNDLFLHYVQVVKELIHTCKVGENKSNAGKYAEARWNAVEALLK